MNLEEFWKPLYSGDVNCIQILPNIGFYYDHTARILEGWIRCMAMLGVKEAQDTNLTYFIFGKGKDCGEFSSDAKLRYDLFKKILPNDLALISTASDGDWVIKLDVWPLIRICSAQITNEWIECPTKPLKFLYKMLNDVSDDEAIKICQCIAHTIPPAIGRNFTKHRESRLAIYEHSFMYSGHGFMIENIFCKYVRTNLLAYIQEKCQRKNISEMDLSMFGELSPISWRRNNLNLEPGDKIELIVIDNKSKIQTLCTSYIRYVIPNTLSTICGCDLVICRANNDKFNIHDENFDDLLRIKNIDENGNVFATSLLKSGSPECYFKMKKDCHEK